MALRKIFHRRPRLLPFLRRHPALRWSLIAAGTALAVFFGVVGWSVATALRAPGTDSVEARLAEWGRDHDLSPAVDWLERKQYQDHPPAVGGALSDQAKALLGGSAGQAAPPRTIASQLPPAVAPFAAPAQAGEGQWRATEVSAGKPLIAETYLRPDASHTSYLTGVAWIDTSAVRFELHPGFSEPGGTWALPSSVPAGARTGLLATWNGGFRLQDSEGGYYQDGRTVGTLRDGAASEIFYTDGSMTIGQWGRDATMGPKVEAVRQNLDLLVDDGKVLPGVDLGVEENWGASLYGSFYVWRSGIGVTANGDLLYACGPALSVRSLAEVLQRAGAVRAMELDINPDWVSFMSYDATTDPTNPSPVKLIGFDRPADRYFDDSSRDFVAAYVRQSTRSAKPH
ncbi:MAG TPA: phosphodiester glycosidase family protein [Actinocrinis sp.]|nr:phosphodiester glycosidase family protein [Actinocrinis sp.]